MKTLLALVMCLLFYASFVREQCAARFDLLAVLSVTFQVIANAFIASPLWRNCEFFPSLYIVENSFTLVHFCVTS
uniref:Putative secreted protein n=1 Tax=Rhipicephalus microplus TaxID=6941 RepID=A0A6G5A464_RHIMP